ncbi:uncharacterized protein [Amphiura filiformis]|uniref:uncharacterized protein n=1 Tax=Amphiura filiformis TaxID=82378 RepID=UPI003B22569F
MDFSTCDSDIFLRWLANQLGSEWMELAIYLNFRADEVDRINMDCMFARTSDKIYAMLTQCRNRQGTGSNLKGILQDALKKCGRQDLAIKVKDEFPSLSKDQLTVQQPTIAIYYHTKHFHLCTIL